MNKSIIDKLIKYGFITNICIDANKYENIDELINKGIITIPGAKQRILELISEELEPKVEPLTTIIEPEKKPETTTVIEPEKKPETTTVIEPEKEPETTTVIKNKKQNKN